MMGAMLETSPRLTLRQNIALAVGALRMWSVRQVLIAAGAALVVAVVIGVATVLIPNPIFGRDIPPVWWNYPVWLVTAAFSGLLFATYIRQPSPDSEDATDLRSSRFGVAGGVLAWFAVGCPVCNKVALLALGYGGAITWFAPVQPFLAALALVLSAVALVWRLRGQVACPVPASAVAVGR